MLSALSGCQAFDFGSDLGEKVTAIRLDPSQPYGGDLVDVEVDWTSNAAYPAIEGSGPIFTYRVNAGELIGQVYQRNQSGGSGVWVEARGQELRTTLSQVKWQLPNADIVARISAALPDGGVTLKVPLSSVLYLDAAD